MKINAFPRRPGEMGHPLLPSKLFTASGYSDAEAPGEFMRQITFTLTAADDSDVNIGNSLIHCEHWTDKDGIEHLNWTIVFEKVAEGKDYVLTVTNADNDADEDEVTLDVGPHHISRYIKIQNPLSHATIPSRGFSPYGTTDNYLPLFAILSVPGASSVNGTLVQGPPATTNWVFQFTQLPTGTGASLTVYSMSQSDTATYLTIN